MATHWMLAVLLVLATLVGQFPSAPHVAAAASPAHGTNPVVTGRLLEPETSLQVRVTDDDGPSDEPSEPPDALVAQQRTAGSSAGVEAVAPTPVPLPGPGFWSLAASLSAPRGEQTATLLPNGKVLIVGGYPPQTNVDLYEPSEDRWTAAPALQTARYGHTATLLPNGKVLVAGGDNDGVFGFVPLDSTELYDPASNTWAPGPSMQVKRVFHTATPLPNGKVLVVGGRTRDGTATISLASSEIYDPVSNTWTAAANALGPRDQHAATLLSDGRVFVTGGPSASGPAASLDHAEIYDPTTNSWTTATPMGASRYSHVLVTLPDGKVLVAGGRTPTSGAERSAEVYDPATNSWRTVTGADPQGGALTATLLSSGFVLVVGGQADQIGLYLDKAQLYDPIANRWSPAASMDVQRAHHTATLLANGEVLVVGTDGRTPVVELFTPPDATLGPPPQPDPTPVPNTWTRAGVLSREPGVAHAATLLGNGKVLVTGGNFTTSQSELYEPATNSWSRAAPPASPRFRHTATLLANGAALIAGGESPAGDGLTDVEVYSPLTFRWATMANMIVGRGAHTATLLRNGKVLLVGGFTVRGNPIAQAELYDPVANSWSPAASLNVARYDHVATLLDDGRVLITGGYSGTPLTPQASAEIYDPVANVWSPAGLMSIGRRGMALAPLPNGRALVVGGVSTNSAEIYDPVTNRWTPTPTMGAARGYPTATTLRNGLVLVAGGLADDVHPLPAELYDPAANKWLPGPSLALGRSVHTSTLLPSGQVLAVGGGGDNHQPAERYTPGLGPGSGAKLEPTLGGPTSLSVAGGQYAPNPFTVTATLRNTGDLAAQAAGATLYLPSGLTLASGSAALTIGEIPPGAERQVSWNVRASGQSNPSTLSYFIQAMAANASVSSVARQISAPALFSIDSFTPRQGGLNGDVTVDVRGSGIQPGATIRLVGPSIVMGSQVYVASGGQQLTARFVLAGAPQGDWDVIVTNPNDTAATLRRGFSTAPSISKLIGAYIVGPTTVRLGRPQTYRVSVVNSGNVDAIGVPVWIKLPKSSNPILATPLRRMPAPFSTGDVPLKTSDIFVDVGDYIVMPLLLSKIPANSTTSIPIVLNFPTLQEIEIRTWTSQCMYQSPMHVDWQSCLEPILLELIDFMLELVQDDCARQLIRHFRDEGLAIRELLSSIQGNTVMSLTEFITGIHLRIVELTIECGDDALKKYPPIAVILAARDIIDLIVDGYGLWVNCKEAIAEQILANQKVRPVQAFDPNDIYGPSGYGPLRHVGAVGPLTYNVVFENKPDATAAAQEVVVTDQLDVGKYDLSTFEFGAVNFGDRRIEPPPGLKQWSTDVDLRPANNLIVRINAGLDQATGLITWRFISLDPATMLPTEDALAGFLPPNKVSPEGEGGVFYSVAPKAGLAHGTELKNKASIVFDVNAPIETPEWLNTIDASKPTSQVQALVATQTSASFGVNWGGNDQGAGVVDYTVYVSEDNGPYQTWQVNTAATSATFTGLDGKAYRFYSVARDGANNREDVPAGPDATTRVQVPPPIYGLTVTKAGTGTGVVTSGDTKITCGADCQEQYAPGTQVTLTAVAATGNDMATFAGWTGACAPAGTNPTCTVTIQKDETVQATFQRNNVGVVVGPQPIVLPNGDRQLVATLTARAGCGAIGRVQFGAAGVAFNNARVGIVTPAGGPSGQTTGFDYRPPAGTTSVTLTIERVVRNGGATVSPIVLVDGCGEWRTFVGGGVVVFQ